MIVLPPEYISNTAEKIFLSNAESTHFQPLLPHNALSNTTQHLDTLSLIEPSSQPIEIKDTYLERSDLNNYYYFKQKKNIAAWNKRNANYSDPIKNSNNVSQHAYIEPDTFTFDAFIDIN